MSQTIPKVIHYFWFSGEKMPRKLQNCLDSWQLHLPDYTIKKWDLSSFEPGTEFEKRAISEKKWAFLSDFLRFKVLHDEGGIYMDTDMLLLKSIPESTLQLDSFWSSTNDNNVDPFIIGASPKNEIINSCLQEYLNMDMDFIDYPVVPYVIAPIFKKIGYDFNGENNFDYSNNRVFSHDVFCPLPYKSSDTRDIQSFLKPTSIGVHLWNTAWNDPFTFFWQGRIKSGWKSVWRSFKKKPLQGFQFYKNVFYHLKCQIFGYPKP